MADSQTEIRDEVRALTDYSKNIFSDAEMDEVIGIAEDEVRAEISDPSLTFYQGNDTFNADRAVMWLSALFAKIRSGEIEGVELSAGDLDTNSLSAPNTFWYIQFQRRLSQVDGTPGFGSTQVTREDDRTYAFET